MPTGIHTVDLVPRHCIGLAKQRAGTGTRPYDRVEFSGLFNDL